MNDAMPRMMGIGMLGMLLGILVLLALLVLLVIWIARLWQRGPR